MRREVYLPHTASNFYTIVTHGLGHVHNQATKAQNARHEPFLASSTLKVFVTDIPVLMPKTKKAINSCWLWTIDIPSSCVPCKPRNQAQRISRLSIAVILTYRTWYPPTYWRKVAHKFYEIFSNILNIFGLKPITIIAYHPEDHQRSWHIFVQPLMYMYNTHVNRSIMETPSRLLLSRHMPGSTTFVRPLALLTSAKNDTTRSVLQSLVLHIIAVMQEKTHKKSAVTHSR